MPTQAEFITINRGPLAKIFIFAVGLCFTSSPAFPQATTFTGSINKSLPAVTISVHYASGSDKAAGFRIVSKIHVYSHHKLIQTIAYAEGDDNQPIFPDTMSVALTDVDCDGNKDLLVPLSVGVGGNAWYHLYRYDPAAKKFVEYDRFQELSYVSVNCKSKTLKTYMNSGAAGCTYTAGTYRWMNGELQPIRTEDQTETSDELAERTITTYTGKVAHRITRAIKGTDCHAP